MGFIVIKRDGTEEPFSLPKIEKIINFVSVGLNIDLDKFIENFQFTFKNKITTKEIQKNLISTANQLSIDPDTEEVHKDFSIMANRLFLIDFWKDFRNNRECEYNTLTDEFGHFKNSSDWIKHLEKYISLGVYDERLLKINKDILKRLYVFIKRVNNEFEDYPFPHFMWNNFYYQSLKFKKSYLIKYDGKEIETFEEALLLLSIMGFIKDYKEDKELFIKNVKRFYRHLIRYHFIPATPQLLNLRRQGGNLSSCNIFDIHDNIESIYYSLTQAALISKNAGGIGIYAGRIRPESSYLMNNPNLSNHITSWLKLFNQTMVAVNQGGMRKGSATIALPIWHKDIQGFIQAKNPLGEQRYKMFDIFPQVIIPKIFIEKLKKEEPWYLVDNHEITMKYPHLDLVEKYGDEFAEAYEKVVELINKGEIKNYEKIDPVKILIDIFKNITNSGLPYIVFEDNVNNYSPFKEKIYSLNLCVESFSPFRNTNPENKKPSDCIPKDEIGYMHSCNLFSLNLPRLYEDNILFDDDKLEEVMDLVVRYMDNILEISNPPVEEIRNHNQYYRTIGVGFIGFADLMVILSRDRKKLYTYKFTKRAANNPSLREEYKNNLLSLIKEVFGRISFYTMLASTKLAKYRGAPIKYKYTKWPDGILLGRYKLNKDLSNTNEIANIFNVKEEKVKELGRYLFNYGIRNTMLLNSPPNTSTSIYAGTSASIFPVYNLYTKEAQQSATYITFPRYIDYTLYYDVYQNWSTEDVMDIITFVSNVQKYIDSGISFEYPININILKKDNIPDYMFDMFYYSADSGIKALYYGRPITTQGKSDKNENDCVSCAN